VEPSARLIALIAAVALDAALGEPPDALHPVAWLGTTVSWLLRAAPRTGPWRQLAFGAAVALGVPLAGAALVAWILAATAAWPVAQLVLGIALLKPTFALRALGRAAERVRGALVDGDLARARAGLSSLCSRDASALDAPLVAAAAVESVAENASDSVVAPLFYYAVFGLPGAVAYRAVNTLDAMIGYHGRYEYLGKAAARLDDALNFVPARLTAALLVIAAALTGHDAAGGWRVWRVDGGATESPNAGRPMAAMAGLLGTALEKPGHYRLGAAGGAATASTIRAAWRVVTVACAIDCAIVALALGARHVLAR
jgi:adenosylcobinamide-phosphate synthase